MTICEYKKIIIDLFKCGRATPIQWEEMAQAVLEASEAGKTPNGDPAPWSDLLAGGKYEKWLCQLEEAKLVVKALEQSFPKKEV